MNESKGKMGGICVPSEPKRKTPSLCAWCAHYIIIGQLLLVAQRQVVNSLLYWFKGGLLVIEGMLEWFIGWPYQPLNAWLVS